MAARRITRSNTSLIRSAIPRSGDLARDGNSLAGGSVTTTATIPALKKRQRRSYESDENPAILSAKRARIQTPESREKTSSKHSQDNTKVPSHLLDSKAGLSFDRSPEPQRTTITPRGSRLVSVNQEPTNASPSKTGASGSTTTTHHILDEACAHLIKMEPALQPLIEKHYCQVFCPEGLAEECEPFRSLSSSIISQQVSGAAASSIKRKFVGLFNGEKLEGANIFPTPGQVAACDIAFLRQAGLSERKAEYIKGLAQKFACGELSASMLTHASDEEVLEKLTAVRGLGKWSVEMFACFGLKRMDILSTGDLGVQRGMAAFMGKDVKKLKAKGGGKWKYMSEQDMLNYSEKFAPYRSLFMFYMWKVLDVDVNAIEDMKIRRLYSFYLSVEGRFNKRLIA